MVDEQLNSLKEQPQDKDSRIPESLVCLPLVFLMAKHGSPLIAAITFVLLTLVLVLRRRYEFAVASGVIGGVLFVFQVTSDMFPDVIYSVPLTAKNMVVILLSVALSALMATREVERIKEGSLTWSVQLLLINFLGVWHTVR